MSYGGTNSKAGISGNMAAGLGKYWAQAAPQMAKQGWSMMQPYNMAQYNLPLQAGMADFGTATDQWKMGIQESAFPFQTFPSMVSGTYGTPVVTPNSSQGWINNAANMLGLGLGFQQLFGGD